MLAVTLPFSHPLLCLPGGHCFVRLMLAGPGPLDGSQRITLTSVSAASTVPDSCARTAVIARDLCMQHVRHHLRALLTLAFVVSSGVWMCGRAPALQSRMRCTAPAGGHTALQACTVPGPGAEPTERRAKSVQEPAFVSGGEQPPRCGTTPRLVQQGRGLSGLVVGLAAGLTRSLRSLLVGPRLVSFRSAGLMRA